MTSDTFERVRAIIAKHAERAIEQVQADASLEEDLGLDSLGALEVIFEIEEEFKILVPNERAAEFKSVRSVCDGIEALQRAAATAG